MLTGINGRTKVCGIYGCPVEHSFSPAMHNAAFDALDLDFVYVPFLVEPSRLPAAVEAVRSLGLAGVNVTIPHKQAVLPLLDEITEEARLIGAVNTIVNNSGCLLGDNTDGRGFLRALQEQAGFSPAGKTALIMGAGGAARAVSVQLVLAGIRKLFLSNRSRTRAEALASLLVKNTGLPVAEVVPWPVSGENPDLSEELPLADLVVQTTPVGMHPDEGSTIPLPLSSFGPGQVVCDLIYNPPETMFMKRASQVGATALNGIGMLLYQGVLSFEQWTGKTAPVEVMRESLLKCLHWRI
ncbi:MAG: Quinate/shikimate dehydrogenase [Pelotomaculum sp. PtaB.Bin013]|uniref:Shikimate dehydrogenase (NADP(+)) n=1 Tax=Pelotomaculum isophthalicicum JI TaxID=947010 RepID=A0A9X4H418_9FIRM|nr:shikimate dehydrogenase [Pelotomaculum isophthalicicum]MDF9409481.1 shikimate dehydrogenase [Pelotomaculum isophthalicicum JI]OPX92221.1 MAG: Quinate/shikimate dehydrogenase [Pelotomaculum sp. PtaB.Bin013]